MLICWKVTQIKQHLMKKGLILSERPETRDPQQRQAKNHLSPVSITQVLQHVVNRASWTEFI